MNILSVDPGGTTGIAVKAAGTYLTAVATEPNQVYAYLVDPGLIIDLVLIERFATGAWIDRYGLATVEIVGGVEALCWHMKLKLVRRIPAHRMPGIPEATRHVMKVPALAALAQKPRSHHIDALAHIFAYERIMKRDGIEC